MRARGPNASPKLRMPALLLQADLSWECERPIATEPGRWGRVRVMNEATLHRWPWLRAILDEHEWTAAYFEPAIVRRAARDYPAQFRGRNSRVLTAARALEQDGDRVGGALVASLAFAPSVYSAVTETVRRKLTMSQLGMNREMVGPILAELSRPSRLEALKERSETEPIVIYDPFAGGGALMLLVAELLHANGITNFRGFVGDLDPSAFRWTCATVPMMLGGRFEHVLDRLEAVQGDAVLLESAPDHLDLVLSTQCLHEEGRARVRSFMAGIRSRLEPGGMFMVVDTTRHGPICDRARQRLPWLNRYGGVMGFSKHLRAGRRRQAWQSLREAFLGNPYVALSGLRSYESGFVKDELQLLLEAAGFLRERVMVEYNVTPPIGTVQLVASN